MGTSSGAVLRSALLTLAVGLASTFPTAAGAAVFAAETASTKMPVVTLDEAAKGIPFDKLDAAAQSKVRQVLSNVSVFRRLPVRVVDCDPNLYLFLLRHPDVVVNMWEVLKLTMLSVQETGPNAYRSTEPDGTVCNFEYLYQSHDTHIVYAEGTYTGPLFKRQIKGSCLLVLKSGYVQETNGRYYITNRLDAFLNVEPGAVELVTKTIQPLLAKVADNNFTQSLAFAGSLSRTAEVNGAGVARLAERLERVQPEKRVKLADLAREISQKAQAAEAARSSVQQAQRLEVITRQ
ncbi:MAG: hypothetical protein ACOY3P_21260 [Planctomycetota bacterium]